MARVVRGGRRGLVNASGGEQGGVDVVRDSELDYVQQPPVVSRLFRARTPDTPYLFLLLQSTHNYPGYYPTAHPSIAGPLFFFFFLPPLANDRQLSTRCSRVAAAQSARSSTTYKTLLTFPCSLLLRLALLCILLFLLLACLETLIRQIHFDGSALSSVDSTCNGLLKLTSVSALPRQ